MGDLSMGMIGLGVMGRNLALNIEEKGFSVAAYDAWPEAVGRLRGEAAGKRIEAFGSIEAFAAALERPRRIVLLVKAGEVVDRTLAALRPYLDPGDLVIDGGNEHFLNTERRAKELAGADLHFFGMGISGGEMGARHGPSLMPGGDEAAYSRVAPVLANIAAQHPDGPCVTYVGPGGSGHYVKMVHNGIEYGDMQLIAEAYDALRSLGGLSNAEIADAFDAWNEGELASFLVEITAKIFRVRDPLGDGDLVDAIVDASGMKGTGKWTVEDAAELGVAIPTIAASVEARVLSAARAARARFARALAGPAPAPDREGRARLVADVRAALYAAKVCSYAQGMSLLARASEARGWGLRLSELARIWQDGCIIRAKLLGHVKAAYERDPALESLLVDPAFQRELAARQEGWRAVVARGVGAGLPLPGLSASLAYYDTLRRERLPANLVQAQRDFFGAHTYRRLDREGDFHTDWAAAPSK
jgi:6-phosphogluconate dehydrogenase